MSDKTHGLPEQRLPHALQDFYRGVARLIVRDLIQSSLQKDKDEEETQP